MCIVMVLLEVTKTKSLGHKSLKQILFHSTFDLNSCNVENASLARFRYSGRPRLHFYVELKLECNEDTPMPWNISHLDSPSSYLISASQSYLIIKTFVAYLRIKELKVKLASLLIISRLWRQPCLARLPASVCTQRSWFAGVRSDALSWWLAKLIN